MSLCQSLQMGVPMGYVLPSSLSHSSVLSSQGSSRRVVIDTPILCLPSGGDDFDCTNAVFIFGVCPYIEVGIHLVGGAGFLLMFGRKEPDEVH